MAQKEAHNEVLKNRTFRLSEYDFELMLKLAKKSGFNTYSDYIRYLINQKVVRK